MMDQPFRKKLIDVSLPLEAINKASIREKAIRHGHPSTLHTWWSRKPLATCRAILFASLVDDPSSCPERFQTEQEQDAERERLFKLIEKMVIWENSTNEEVLSQVQAEIHTTKEIQIPPIRDPFCGGGSIPLEALRLGVQARSSDLNPVAVLITKALIEIPPKFAGCPPVNPDAQQALVPGKWQGARGLANDIRYYGKWMRDEAKKRIGNLYPKVKLPLEDSGDEATVIAWLWVRTITCPNPACGAQMPLTSTWWLSKKKGKATWVEPIIDTKSQPHLVRFVIKRTSQSQPQEGTVNRKGARCIVCNTSVPFAHLRSEGKAGHMGKRLLAIVAEGKQGRIYLAPNERHSMSAAEANPTWSPDTDLPDNPRDFKTPNYGMRTFADLFTPRQLVALTTFSDLVQEVRLRVLLDAQQIHFPDDRHASSTHVTKAVAYADAIATYMAIAIDRLADRGSSICSWDSGYVKVRNTFARQAIPMIWDFAEANPFSSSTGNFRGAIDWVAEVIEASPCDQDGEACLGMLLEEEQALSSKTTTEVYQRDATVTINGVANAIIVTDPPYYDNISYAELSDFFYVWLRRSLHMIYPDLFETVLTPKEVELVADPYRFGSKEKARTFFETHLSAIFRKMYGLQSKDYPLILYYAFKQTETETENESTEDGYTSRMLTSTGWETMLESLIQTGFTITGTWPIRTEMLNRSVGQGTNVLASSIVLVCRPRLVDAPIATRRHFLTALRNELPLALKKLQYGGIAPVDLAQACVGPGMAIYSRYRQVVEADGTPLQVRTALQLINRALDEGLSEQEGEYDAETRWAIAWFEQHALTVGTYGDAETLSKAKNISVESIAKMGWLEAKMGKVRLRKREELATERSSLRAETMTIWEAMQRMIYALHEQGEESAAIILHAMGGRGEIVRDLAYRLYTICERKGWAQEALVYNGLVSSWLEMSRYAQNASSTLSQITLF